MARGVYYGIVGVREGGGGGRRAGSYGRWDRVATRIPAQLLAEPLRWIVLSGRLSGRREPRYWRILPL